MEGAAMTLRLSVLLVLLLPCSLVRAQVTQQDPADSAVATRSTVQGPRLGEHLFSPIAGAPLPFIRTVTTMNVGVGVSQGLDLPLFEIGGEPVYASVGELAVVGFFARHEQAIKPWMSFYVEMRLTGRLGTNITSLLGQGINTVTGFDLGWNVRILENQKWSVITGLGLEDGSYTTIDIQRWAQGVIDSGYVTADNQLFDTKPALKASWTSSAAYTFNEALGIYGVVTAGVAEPKVRNGEYSLLLDGLLALSVDWDPVIDVPIGTTLGVEYRENPEISGADEGSYKNVYLRLGYTGEDAFGLGVQMMYQYAPIGGAVSDVSYISGALDMRFYF